MAHTSISNFGISNAAISCEERQSPGYICESCDRLSICLKRSNGWETLLVEACDTDNGFYCNALEESCSNATGACNPALLAFRCTSAGIFPDPFDCQAYHVCYKVGNNFVSGDLHCGTGAAFHPGTGDCSLKIEDKICTDFRYECTRAGDAAAWPMNSNIFYICVIEIDDKGIRHLYPNLYRCPPNEVFDGSKCVNDDGGASSSSTTPSTSFRCPSPGLFPDVDNCTKYFYCNYDLSFVHHTCPLGTFFSTTSSACVIGNC